MVEREGALPVLSDPQFGLSAILRPYVGFDAQPGGAGTGSYQAVDGATPIMFTEGSEPFDSEAGKVGYSKRLLKGMPVPYGARVVLWLPTQSLLGVSSVGGQVVAAYRWFVVWRQRNTFDYRTQRKAFHFPKQGAGIADTTPGDAGPRVILPSAGQVSVFNSLTQSVSNSQAAVQAAYDWMEPSLQGFMATGPLIPPISGLGGPFAGVGLYSQGLVDPGTATGNMTIPPPYQAFEIQSEGDEMMVGVNKVDMTASGGTTTWDFTSATQDQVFSTLFGRGTFIGVTGPFPDIGVYVNVGVST